MSPQLLNQVLGPEEDRAQRLRIRRFLLAVGSYALWTIALLTASALGLTEATSTVLGAFAVALAVSQLVLYALFRTGWNLRFADPALTVPQLMLGIAWSMALIALLPELRGHALMATLVVLLFGVFALNRGQFVRIAVFAYACYLVLMVVEHRVDPTRTSGAYHLLSAMIFAVVLTWAVAFGSYVSNLRHRLSARNESLETALDRIRELAERDDLTSLVNRRSLMAALPRELARAERGGTAVTVAMIDLDHFKTINDTHGHTAGDRVLADFGRFLLEELRAMDYVAVADGPDDETGNGTIGRYGGEEFLLILPETDRPAAEACLERLRKHQDERTDRAEGVHRVTFSVGVAQHRPGEAIQDLLRRADEALYEAKKRGRNRVCAAA